MDPVVAGQTAEFLKASGPYGAIAVLVFFIGMLLRHVVKLQEKIVEIQDKRAAEVRDLGEKTATGLANSSSATAAQGLATGSTNILLQKLLDVVQVLPAANEAIAKGVSDNGASLASLREIVIRQERP